MSIVDKVRDVLVRALLTGTESSQEIQTAQATIFDGELEDDIEHFEPYGFTSRAHEGAEVLLAHLDGDRSHPLAVVITDRRYRVKNLKRGEVCIFDSKGRKVYLKDTGIEVEGVSSPVKVHTTGTVTVDAPTAKFTGNVQIAGKLTVTGEITGMGITYSTHVHSGVEHGSSNTGGPV